MSDSHTSKNDPNLLIVDDDETLQRLLVIAARDLGWRPVVAGSGEEALDLFSPTLSAVVLDQDMPGMKGIQTLVKIRHLSPSLPVIMLTGLNDAETAVQAMRAGAADYLTKPFEFKRLFNLLGQCRQARKNEPTPATPVSRRTAEVSELRSANPQVRELLGNLAKAARFDSTILLTGESGTGKSHFAREIHRLSPRAEEDFITVSCPALPRDLLESELFGHERGAFTGATASRTGRFEQATQGTLFLDEIGDLPAELQPKLLTVLQDREFFRVGGSKQLDTNARVIAATNINLRERVQQGTFREDLYYRLNIIELHIPRCATGRRTSPRWSPGSWRTSSAGAVSRAGGFRREPWTPWAASTGREISASSRTCSNEPPPSPKKPCWTSTTSGTSSKDAAKAGGPAAGDNRSMTLQEVERNRSWRPTCAPAITRPGRRANSAFPNVPFTIS